MRQLDFLGTPAAGTTTLIAASLGGGMFKGVDNGSSWTWQSINNGLPTGRIWTLDAIDANTAYVGTDGSGFYKTTDGGGSWLPLNGSGATALGCMVVKAISISGSTLYAGTRCRYDSGLYKSTNGGITWARIGASVIPSDVEARSIRVSGTLVFFTTANYGIFKSADSGATWAQANSGIAGANLDAFNTQCGTSCSALMLTYVHGQGIYKSTNAGATWSASNTGLPGGAAALSGLSKDGTVFFVSLDKQGIYHSVDNGANWSLWGNTATRSETAFPRGVSRDSSAPGKYYLATLEGVYKTLDDGLTWTTSKMGNGRVAAVIHDISNQSIAYLATATVVKISDIYASSQDATLIDSGITGTTNDGVTAQDPANANVLYATTNNRGIFKSVNGGASWSAINAGLPSLVGQSSRLSIDKANSQTLYLGFTNGAGIYKSTNGGANWTAANAGLANEDAKSVYRIEIDRNTPSTLYAATAEGLYKSTDSAATWILVYSALDSGGKLLGVSNVRLNPSNSQEIYLANSHTDPNGTLLASSGIQKSTNGGLTWTNVLPGKRVENMRVLQGGVVYAGLSDGAGQPAVRRSTDGGASWQVYSSGLQGSDIYTFGSSPNDDVLISVALENGFYIGISVVEFYNTSLDNYFITADPIEAAAIDNGAAGPGWIRTGNAFKSGGSASVCRFYGSISPGPNSHFYTVDPAECQSLKDQQFPAGDPRKLTIKSWNFESLDFASTPSANQACPGGTVPVYRAYNNGFTRGVDSNHRITGSLTAIQEVVTRGWSNEGVVMCAPQ
ncbi:MAG: hypothetical protein IPO58_11605 [Betaproteobacteria bacterium]|nr:hypothetical protein [Betaproteobacteria bacterium]